MEGEAPEECSTELCKQIIENHLHSNAMWVILPWQDWLSIDQFLRNKDITAERINVPANPENYWRYRMHISLEQLLTETDLNNTIKSLCNNTR
jgi:4-alpha-glucanotransferase